jgi:hypothetical protein
MLVSTLSSFCCCTPLKLACASLRGLRHNCRVAYAARAAAVTKENALVCFREDVHHTWGQSAGVHDKRYGHVKAKLEREAGAPGTSVLTRLDSCGTAVWPAPLAPTNNELWQNNLAQGRLLQTASCTPARSFFTAHRHVSQVTRVSQSTHLRCCAGTLHMGW